MLVSNGCVTGSSLGRNTTYRQAMVKALKADWEHRPTAPFQALLDKSEQPKQSLKESACYQSRQFERYVIDRMLIDILGESATVAWYCPSENRYWVQMKQGDPFFNAVWAGPFVLESSPNTTNSAEE